jgi:hypothetical protein
LLRSVRWLWWEPGGTDAPFQDRSKSVYTSGRWENVLKATCQALEWRKVASLERRSLSQILGHTEFSMSMLDGPHLTIVLWLCPRELPAEVPKRGHSNGNQGLVKHLELPSIAHMKEADAGESQENVHHTYLSQVGPSFLFPSHPRSSRGSLMIGWTETDGLGCQSKRKVTMPIVTYCFLLL